MQSKQHRLCPSAEMVRARIRELRVERRLTQEQLCDLAGISRDAISRIENGSRTPSLGTLERIVIALGVSWDEILRHAPARPGARPPYVTRVAALLEHQPEKIQQVAEALVRAYLRAERNLEATADDAVVARRAAEPSAPYDSPPRSSGRRGKAR